MNIKNYVAVGILGVATLCVCHSMNSINAIGDSKETVSVSGVALEADTYELKSGGIIENIDIEGSIEDSGILTKYIAPTPKPTPNPSEGIEETSDNAGDGIKEKHETVLKKVTGNGTEVYIPKNLRSEFKCYERYTCITSTSSPQYKLTRSENAHTNEYGIRMYKDRYCIAVGSGVATKIGTKLDLVLANGNVIPCILGDQKSDRDTDDTHMYHRCDGSVVEFIVDMDVFSQVKDSSGTVNFVPGWKGKVSKIVVYK